MQTKSGPPKLDHGDENILMFDRFQMGRINFKDFFIRDQFMEERHPLGHTTVYFWQHRDKDSCTIKVHATTTDSNESAYKAMEHFISHLANPSVFFETSDAHLRSEWLKKVEAVKVHMDSKGTDLIGVTFILGNIFYFIQSSGERDHSIKTFIDSLGDYWSFIDKLKDHRAEKKLDKDHFSKFQLSANKTELKIGEVATISRQATNNEREYSSFLYVGFPKRLVNLYKENGVLKLKIKSSESKAIMPPSVIMIGILPDGKHVRSNRLKFTIVPS